MYRVIFEKFSAKLKGKVRFEADLSKTNWFGVGGKAEILFIPEDRQDLKNFLKENGGKIPITIIGFGSNIIIRDGGIKGVVIKFGAGFNKLSFENNAIIAGCANLCANVAKFSAENNLGGLEFLVGIPGSIGGAIAMNAGAYEAEVKDVLVSTIGINKITGEEKIFNHIDFSYRHNPLAKDYIFVEGGFKGTPQPKEIGLKKIASIQEKREQTQPIKSKTGGSTFKNPPEKKAWQLIDEAGLRGYKLGGAMVSEKHCNFLINTANATAKDIEDLGNLIQQKVYEKTGIKLEWEIKIIGEKNVQ